MPRMRGSERRRASATSAPARDMAALRRAGSGIAASNRRDTIGGTTRLPNVPRRRSIGRVEERRRSPRHAAGHEGSDAAWESSSIDTAALGRVAVTTPSPTASPGSRAQHGGGETLF